MSEEELLKIAEGVAAQRILVENLGAANSPTGTEDRIKAIAYYIVEKDKLAIKESAYQTALRQFAREMKCTKT